MGICTGCEDVAPVLGDYVPFAPNGALVCGDGPRVNNVVEPPGEGEEEDDDERQGDGTTGSGASDEAPSEHARLVQPVRRERLPRGARRLSTRAGWTDPAPCRSRVSREHANDTATGEPPRRHQRLEKTTTGTTRARYASRTACATPKNAQRRREPRTRSCCDCTSPQRAASRTRSFLRAGSTRRPQTTASRSVYGYAASTCPSTGSAGDPDVAAGIGPSGREAANGSPVTGRRAGPGDHRAVKRVRWDPTCVIDRKVSLSASDTYVHRL